MNKKYFNQLLFCFSLVITLLCCNKKNEDRKACLLFANAPVTKIEGATAASVNEEVVLTVSFACTNGCGQFGSFAEVTTGNTTTITVNAKYEGCICTQDIPTRQTLYKFKKSQAGTFALKFLQADNTYLTHTIIVQ